MIRDARTKLLFRVLGKAPETVKTLRLATQESNEGWIATLKADLRFVVSISGNDAQWSIQAVADRVNAANDKTMPMFPDGFLPPPLPQPGCAVPGLWACCSSH